MAAESKVLKGYVKTENMILIVALAVAIGFVGGVIFSAYRASKSGPIAGPAASSASVSEDQKKMLSALKERVNKNPNDLEAWTQLGHLYFDMDQPRDAIEAYEHSLKLDGNRPDVWTDLGVMYRRNEEPQKAVEKFDQALKLNPNHQIALYNKGIVLMHDLKDPKGAIAAWEALLAINPEARTPNGDLLRDIVQQLKQMQTGASQ
ncbi:MAG: tetratricopeptide repeat protein [Desulfobacteraceae bacterium]|nr:tetratricopeptide repeat protein [Desulfobacteraceae bacterium]